MKGIDLKVADSIFRSHRQCHLDIKLLISIFGDSRILEAE